MTLKTLCLIGALLTFSAVHGWLASAHARADELEDAGSSELDAGPLDDDAGSHTAGKAGNGSPTAGSGPRPVASVEDLKLPEQSCSVTGALGSAHGLGVWAFVFAAYAARRCRRR